MVPNSFSIGKNGFNLVGDSLYFVFFQIEFVIRITDPDLRTLSVFHLLPNNSNKSVKSMHFIQAIVKGHE